VIRSLAVVIILSFAGGNGSAQTQQQQKPRAEEYDIPISTLPGLPPGFVWNEPYEPTDFAYKTAYHVRRLIGPWGIGQTLAGSAWDQWTNDPEEWGQGWDAYAQRFGSRVAVRSVRRGIHLLVGGVRGEHPHYFRSGERRFWARVKNQLFQTVVVRTDDGGTTFAAGRWTAAYGAAAISQAWMPDSKEGAGRVFRKGSLVIAGDLGTRMLREFWPDIKRIVFRRKD
jgi:hypothetical protein